MKVGTRKRLLYLVFLGLIMVSLLGSIAVGCSSTSTTTATTTAPATTVTTTAAPTTITSTAAATTVTTTAVATPLSNNKPAIVIKVGFLGPTSGSWGPVGINYKQGAQLAVEEINQDGWFVVNGQKYTLEFHLYDTRGDAKTSVALANKMVQDGIKFAVSIPIEAYMDDQQITEAGKIIQMGPGLPDWARAGIKYTFCDSWGQWMGNAYRMVMAPTGQENKYTVFKNVNNVAMLSIQDPMNVNLVDGFKNEGKLLGNNIKLVYEQAIPGDQADYSSVISAMKAAKPDMVFNLIGEAESQLTVYPQFRELGFDRNIINMDNIVGRDNQARILATDAANGLVESLWYLPHMAPTPPDWVVNELGYDPAVRDRYIKDIIAQFGEEAETSGAAHAYDFVYDFVKNAILSGDPTNSDAIVAQLEKEVTYKGAANAITFFKEDHMDALPILLVRLKNIDNKVGTYSVDYLGGGRSTTYYADVDFSKATFEFTVGTQIDASQPRAGQ